MGGKDFLIWTFMVTGKSVHLSQNSKPCFTVVPTQNVSQVECGFSNRIYSSSVSKFQTQKRQKGPLADTIISLVPLKLYREH